MPKEPILRYIRIFFNLSNCLKCFNITRKWQANPCLLPTEQLRHECFLKMLYLSTNLSYRWQITSSKLKSCRLNSMTSRKGMKPWTIAISKSLIVCGCNWFSKTIKRRNMSTSISGSLSRQRLSARTCALSLTPSLRKLRIYTKNH